MKAITVTVYRVAADALEVNVPRGDCTGWPEWGPVGSPHPSTNAVLVPLPEWQALIDVAEKAICVLEDYGDCPVIVTAFRRALDAVKEGQ